MATKLETAVEKLSAMFDPHDAHVGIGEGVLIVYVTASKSMSKRFEHTLPKSIDGHPVCVQYVGKIRPLVS